MRAPLSVAGHAATFAVAGYAAVQVAGLRNPWSILVWFVGAILLHDFVLFPLYSAVDRAAERLLPAGRRGGRIGVNVVRVPALLSGLLLLAWFPLILERAPGLYGSITGVEQPDYLARWLLITGGLFAVSGAVAVVRSGAAKAGDRRAARPEDRVEQR